MPGSDRQGTSSNPRGRLYQDPSLLKRKSAESRMGVILPISLNQGSEMAHVPGGNPMGWRSRVSSLKSRVSNVDGCK